MRLRLFIAFGIVAIMIIACSRKGNTAKTGVMEKNLKGKWELMKTGGGFSGRGRPVKSGEEFLTFKKGGLYTSSCKDFGTEGEYKVERKLVWGEERDIVVFNSSPNSYIITFRGQDTLSLAFAVADGFQYHFVRR